MAQMKLFVYKMENGKPLYMEGESGANMPKIISENLTLQRDKSGYKYYLVPEKPEMVTEEVVDKTEEKVEEKKACVADLIRSFVNLLPKE